MLIQELLKHYRIRSKMSQEELADQLFVTRQAVSKWERGESYPDIENIIRLSDLYDISIDELLRGARFLEKPYVVGIKKTRLKYLLNLIISLLLSSIIYQNVGTIVSLVMALIYFMLGMLMINTGFIEFRKNDVLIMNYDKWYQKLYLTKKNVKTVYQYDIIEEFEICYIPRRVRQSLDWGPDDFHIKLKFDDGRIVEQAMTKKLQVDLPILTDFLKKKKLIIVDDMDIVEKLIKGLDLYLSINDEKNGN